MTLWEQMSVTQRESRALDSPANVAGKVTKSTVLRRDRSLPRHGRWAGGVLYTCEAWYTRQRFTVARGARPIADTGSGDYIRG